MLRNKCLLTNHPTRGRAYSIAALPERKVAEKLINYLSGSPRPGGTLGGLGKSAGARLRTATSIVSSEIASASNARGTVAQVSGDVRGFAVARIGLLEGGKLVSPWRAGRRIAIQRGKSGTAVRDVHRQAPEDVFDAHYDSGLIPLIAKL